MKRLISLRQISQGKNNMKLVHILFLFIAFVSLCACEPIQTGYEVEDFDPIVLVGQWSRIQDSTSIVTITEDYIDFYSDGQYVCEYSYIDHAPGYSFLYMNRLWLNEDVRYKKDSCMFSISSDYKTLYIRWADPKPHDNGEYYFNDVVLIKM